MAARRAKWIVAIAPLAMPRMSSVQSTAQKASRISTHCLLSFQLESYSMHGLIRNNPIDGVAVASVLTKRHPIDENWIAPMTVPDDSKDRT
jgi:hypothetical protein